MREIKFPLARPYFALQEVKEVGKVLKSGWLTQGEYIKTLEDKIKHYNRVKYAFLLNSATSGLIASIQALNLNKKDEVIIPSFTFPATANSVILARAKLVFCDIDLETFNISMQNLESSINKNTRAVMVVHQFGLSADMEAILKITKKYNLFVIEDAACSFGSEYKNKKVGSFGDMGVFSFHPRKIITSGEGGCVVTNSETLAKKIEVLRNHGEFNKNFIGVGYNFRLSDIQGAVLLSQFERIEELISKRIRLASNYNKFLRPLEDRGLLKTPFSLENYRHTYQSYVVLLANGINRDKLKILLRNKGIEVQIGTYCIPSLDFFRKNFAIPKRTYSNAYSAYKHTLALPLYYALDNKGQVFIIEQLSKLIEECAE